MSRDNKACKTCKYFEEFVSGSMAECRKSPPKIVKVVDTMAGDQVGIRTFSSFPSVMPDMYCHEWENGDLNDGDEY